MADPKNYTASTQNPPSAQHTDTAEAHIQDNSYTASSSKGRFELTKGDVLSAIPKLGNTGAYKIVSNILGSGNTVFRTGLKLSLSEVGFWKQLFVYGGRAETEGVSPKFDSIPQFTTTSGQNQNQSSTQPTINRSDIQNEFVFRCGDYFLPLSMSFSVRAKKRASTSQLVDGAEIIQIVNKQPKTIDVTIHIERDKSRLSNNTYATNMAMMDGKLIDALGGTDSPYFLPTMAVAELGVAIKKLYEDQDVFQVQNKTLNNDLGVTWVFMEEYEFTPNIGSTVVDIKMSLREVNMTENAIIFGNSTVDSSKSAGGGA